MLPSLQANVLLAWIILAQHQDEDNVADEGELMEASKHCEAALEIDPQDLEVGRPFCTVFCLCLTASSTQHQRQLHISLSLSCFSCWASGHDHHLQP